MELKKLFILVNADGSFKGDIFPAFINRVNAEAELKKEAGKICVFQELDPTAASTNPVEDHPLHPKEGEADPVDGDDDDKQDDKDDVQDQDVQVPAGLDDEDSSGVEEVPEEKPDSLLFPDESSDESSKLGDDSSSDTPLFPKY